MWQQASFSAKGQSECKMGGLWLVPWFPNEPDYCSEEGAFLQLHRMLEPCYGPLAEQKV